MDYENENGTRYEGMQAIIYSHPFVAFARCFSSLQTDKFFDA